MYKKGFINIIIIGVIVLLIAVAGYFVLTKNAETFMSTAQKNKTLNKETTQAINTCVSLNNKINKMGDYQTSERDNCYTQIAILMANL